MESGNSLTISPATASAIYYVVARDIVTGCETAASAAATVSLTVHPLPSIPTIEPDDTSWICEDDDILLTALPATAATYIWRRDGLEVQNSSSNTYLANLQGTYTVLAITASGCPSSNESAEKFVGVIRHPLTPVLAGGSSRVVRQVLPNPNPLTVSNAIQIENYSALSGATFSGSSVQYYWYQLNSAGNEILKHFGTDRELLFHPVSPTDAGTYSVEVRTDLGDCRNMSADMHLIVETHITVPNILTPNGDGWNDVFEIPGLESYKTVELLIVNRWGGEVYRSSNYRCVGTDENSCFTGKGLANGVYFYSLRLVAEDGTRSTHSGSITLKHDR